MMDKLSEKTALFLAKKNGFSIDTKRFADTYYGAQIFYRNGFKTLILLVIAIILHLVPYTICILTVAWRLRKYSFGWHLSGFISCLIFGIVVYLSASFLVSKVIFSFWTLLLLWLIILVLVALFAPMDSAKRKIPKQQKPYYKKKSLFVCCFWGTISLIGFVFSKHFTIYWLDKISVSFMLGLACQVVSIIPIHLLINKKEKSK